MLMTNIILVLLSFTLVSRDALCKPASGDSDSNPLTICYSLNCPENTSACGKRSEISHEDKTKLDVEVRCYDVDGNILKSKKTTEDNPFGPNVYYKGTKFSAVIKVLPSYGSDDQEEDNNDVPIYLNLPSRPVSKTGPKSEVEDLNSK